MFTRQEMSHRTQNYWLTKTRAGLVLAFSAVLGLLVGAVITNQTFYSIPPLPGASCRCCGPRIHPRRRHAADAGAGDRPGRGTRRGALTWAAIEVGIRFNVQAVLPPWLVAAVGDVTLGTRGPGRPGGACGRCGWSRAGAASCDNREVSCRCWWPRT
ncbi:MAG: hypothetical protein U0797_19440 [Gemmataceae bacterium]